MDAVTLSRLRFTNPWLFDPARSSAEEAGRRRSGPWVERRQVTAARLAAVERAHLLTGPRQAGKSSLIWSVLAQRRRPLFLNLEEATLRAWCSSAAGFLADLQDLGEAPDVLFLEEAQWLPEVGLFVKGIVDQAPGFGVLVTGSASFQLRSRARESLAGRATRDVLLPLGLAEVAPPEGRSPAQLRLERMDAWRRMIEVGGYPAAWTSEQPGAVLSELLEAFVYRDASDLFAVERLDAFQRILQLVAGQVGSLVNVAELASLSGVSHDTASRYLAMMEQAHILRLVPAFAGGRRREVTSAQKVYFLDNGLRRAVLGRSPEPGSAAENLVFTELRKALPWEVPVRYWRSRSGAEVDFVVERAGRLLGVEVKAGRLARTTLSRSSRSFIEAYEPPEFWVLNAELVAEERIGPTRVRWMRWTALPEEVEGWLEGAA
jgi:predicted AAA+ superfamily ATPase